MKFVIGSEQNSTENEIVMELMVVDKIAGLVGLLGGAVQKI